MKLNQLMIFRIFFTNEFQAAAAAAHFSPYAQLYGPTASSLYCSPAALYQHQHQHHPHHLHEPREIQMQMQMQMQSVQQPCGLQLQQQQQQRSPVDVLLRVFPGRRRADVEGLLHRCKGTDVMNF